MDPLPLPAAENREPVASAFSGTEEVEARFVHPEAKSFFDRYPWSRRIPIFNTSCEGFGPKSVISLGLSYCLCRGLAQCLYHDTKLPMLRDRYNLKAMRIQRLMGIANASWSIKPFTAMLCDSFALLGFTKRWYMFISCIVAVASSFCYALLPAEESSANIACIFIFLSGYCMSNVDILSEGYYSRRMRNQPANGPALVSWIWWFITIGRCMSTIIAGSISDHHLPQIGIFVAAAMQLIASGIFFFNCYDEKHNRVDRAEDAKLLYEGVLCELEESYMHPNENAVLLNRNKCDEQQDSDKDFQLQQSIHKQTTDILPEILLSDPIVCGCGLFEFNKDVIQRNKNIFAYSILLTSGALMLVFANIFAGSLVLFICTLTVSVVCCLTSFLVLPRVISKVNVYGYLSSVLFLNFTGATSSFLLAGVDCVPDGPHFTYSFLIFTTFFANIASLGGIVAFNYFFSKRTYRLSLAVTTFIGIICKSFDIIIVKRWNVMIHIPDFMIYIGGDSVISSFVEMMSHMPMVILLSRLCPRGSESIVYAILASFSSLGNFTAMSLGAVLMEWFWPIKSKPPCDFSNLPYLLFIGHMVLPLLIFPLIFMLIPDVNITDNLNLEGHVIERQSRKVMKRLELLNEEKQTRSISAPK